MEFADESFVARIEKDRERYLHFTRLALEKEAAAADLMVDEEDIEPTRSVLHRSAATLAWRCEEYDVAEKLIYRALAGNPRSDIEWELKDLLGTVNLAKAGNHLVPGQLLWSLHGNVVGFGKALVTDLTSRAPSIQQLLQISARSALRKARGKVSDKLDALGEVPVFIEGLEAGSCIVKLRLGEPKQEALPGFERFDGAIEPFMKNVDLLARGHMDLLEDSIVDGADFSDFITAAASLAPDGEKIKAVKFQAVVDNHPRLVSLDTTQSALKGLRQPHKPDEEKRLEVTEQDIVKTGVLRVGNALDDENKTLCIVATESEGNWHIEGTEELKDEIVRQFFKRRIVVHGKRMKRANVVNHILVSRKEDVRLDAEKEISKTLI